MQAHAWHSIAPGLCVTVNLVAGPSRIDDTPERLLERVDAALHGAKREGRSRVVATVE